MLMITFVDEGMLAWLMPSARWAGLCITRKPADRRHPSLDLTPVVLSFTYCRQPRAGLARHGDALRLPAGARLGRRVRRALREALSHAPAGARPHVVRSCIQFKVLQSGSPSFCHFLTQPVPDPMWCAVTQASRVRVPRGKPLAFCPASMGCAAFFWACQTCVDSGCLSRSTTSRRCIRS